MALLQAPPGRLRTANIRRDAVPALLSTGHDERTGDTSGAIGDGMKLSGSATK
jgi:hypothetical protein